MSVGIFCFIGFVYALRTLGKGGTKWVLNADTH